MVFQLVHLRKKLTSGTVPTPLPQLSSHAVQDGLFTGLPVRPQGSETAFRRFFQVGPRRSRRPRVRGQLLRSDPGTGRCPPDDGVHVGWRFLSLPPPQFFFTQGRKPARLGVGAGGTSAILCLRGTCARCTGQERLTGPFPKLEKPPTPRRSYVAHIRNFVVTVTD